MELLVGPSHHIEQKQNETRALTPLAHACCLIARTPLHSVLRAQLLV